MTNPTITYGHGFLTDCDTTTDWTRTDSGTTSTFTITNQTYFKIDVTVAAAPKIVVVANDINIDRSVGTAGTYKKLLYRYKCVGAIKAKIVAEMDGGAGTQETVLAETNSTAWTLGSYAFTTASDTLDHIFFYANGDVGTVYYDFALVHVGVFTFPNAEDIDELFADDLVREPYAGRVGRAPQTVGADDTKIVIVCDLDIGTWTRTGDTKAGQVFRDIVHNAAVDEVWQWLTTGHNDSMKVRLESAQFLYSNSRHLLTLTFYEHLLGTAADESETERFGE